MFGEVRLSDPRTLSSYDGIIKTNFSFTSNQQLGDDWLIRISFRIAKVGQHSASGMAFPNIYLNLSENICTIHKSTVWTWKPLILNEPIITSSPLYTFETVCKTFVQIQKKFNLHPCFQFRRGYQSKLVMVSDSGDRKRVQLSS